MWRLPNIVQNLEQLGKLIHTWSFSTASKTSVRYMSEASSKASNSAFSWEDMLVGLQSSSKCYFHRLTSLVRVTILFPCRTHLRPSPAYHSWVVWCFVRTSLRPTGGFLWPLQNSFFIVSPTTEFLCPRPASFTVSVHQQVQAPVIFWPKFPSLK